jgi:hypothetical protein
MTDENMGMIVCDGCGCPVHPDYLQVHVDFHESLEPKPIFEPILFTPRD